MRLYTHKFALAAGLTMAIVRFIRIIISFMPGSLSVAKYEGSFFSHVEQRTLLIEPAFFDCMMRLLLTFTTSYLIAYLFVTLYNAFVSSRNESEEE